jgi:isocitrate dehydrogenase (NAD+)
VVARHVTLIPGDGIGPDVIKAACTVLGASGADLAWDVHELGQRALDTGSSSPVPESTVQSLVRNGVALKGPVSTRSASGFRSANIALRRALDVYVQVRPVRSFPGSGAREEDLDVVVIRQVDEDVFAEIEYDASSPAAAELREWLAAHDQPIASGTAFTLKLASEAGARRAARSALDWARRNGRRRVTVVHKATVMRATDGLFVSVAREAADEFPELAVDDALIDRVCLELARGGHDFDVLLMPSMFGDIVSDLCAGLAGGIGLAPGANYGDSVALFEAAHGSAPAYAGRDCANPVAMILSGAMLLRHVGEADAAGRVERAVAAVLAAGTARTYDLARNVGAADPVGTRAMTDAVLAELG